MNRIGMNKIKSLLLYGGISEREYNQIEGYRNSFNYSTAIATSIFSILFLVILIITTFEVKQVAVNTAVFFGFLNLSILLLILLYAFREKKDKIVPFVNYFMCILILCFGIMLGTVLTPDRASVSINVMIIAAPFIIAGKPYKTLLIQGAAAVAFIVLCTINKTGDVRVLDIYNISVFTTTGFFITIQSLSTRMNSFVMSLKFEKDAFTDRMTGLRNRHAFDKDVEKYEQMQSETRKIVVMECDINGLKVINDRFGHSAGDELIRAAGEILEDTYSENGTVYRTGGDEFVVVLDEDIERVRALEPVLLDRCERWRGASSQGISLSIGYASSGEQNNAEIRCLLKTADERMYRSKARYYSDNKVNRRINDMANNTAN